jgi:hypothetical protein
MGRPVRIFAVGERYGKLEVIERRDSASVKMILCRCDCGTVKRIAFGDLDRSTSCGCWIRDSKITHGMSGTPLYTAWQQMIGRCTNPKNHKYGDYGARGITVDSRWLTFENFYEDMGDRPEGKTLDRIDNDLGYFPGNCRWATALEQAHNKRPRRDYASRG